MCLAYLKIGSDIIEDKFLDRDQHTKSYGRFGTGIRYHTIPSMRLGRDQLKLVRKSTGVQQSRDYIPNLNL